jgi:16S rRNA G1207 methylase RsmC
MKHLLDLFPVVADRVRAPVAVALSSPWPVTQLVGALEGKEAVCFQMDVFAADRLREKLAQEGHAAEVVVSADLWDLPPRFNTVIFPAAAHSDRELKLDMVEQGFHVLQQGGLFVTLSEYEKDVEFAKYQKKVFGKCSESPKSKVGMAFWSPRDGDRPRRRHAITFHAKIGDGPAMSFESWPGTFGYGRMDEGSRAMLEVADIRPGHHILDMGCGNGSVGCLASAKAGPKGKVTFIDSNARAVALTDLNAKANGVPTYRLVTSATLGGLEHDKFDVILANPPYYAQSEITRLFVEGARDLLKPGGRYYIVTKMPEAVVPMIFDTFGDCSVIENRGYSVILAGV